ncbi:hypothetical protein BGZ60DRAFT_521032 [Tricladium varicosporioides]|nr:hypothetical protein BGZ60DRAFT_521032 [Hymenoscyphus varicosporioides]
MMMKLLLRWTLVCASDAFGEATRVAGSHALQNRAGLDPILLSNATSIVQNLDFTNNCTVSIAWYQSRPSSNSAGFGNETISVQFLRAALPAQYQNESDDRIGNFYNEMSLGNLSETNWLRTAKDNIETVCIAPQFEREISVSNLDASQNCTATALFLGSLGWITGTQNYQINSSNDTSWLQFLSAALPEPYRSNLTDLELLVYRNFFLSSERASEITKLLNAGFDACQKDICKVQGYTGNPDIGGIGVITSYTAEAILVTLYFIAINLQLGLERAGHGNKISEKFQKALVKASEGLSDGALFFSLSISTAGWVSFVSGTSYYEKLVFTSANVLALSALFTFLSIFTKEGRKKRGEYILAVLIAAILTESAIQYIVYLAEPNEKYMDYACLHLQFNEDGYHPTIFEALFFLLFGLSVLAGVIGILWLWHRRKAKNNSKHGYQQSTKLPSTISALWKTFDIETIDKWVTVTRIFIQTVAIAVMWVELVYLWKIRRIMSEIAGATWTEGSWGFGQILALFIWLPPIIDILGWLMLPEWMLGGGKTTECGCQTDKKGHTCNCVPVIGPPIVAGNNENVARHETMIIAEK